MQEKARLSVVRFGPFTLDGRSGELRNGPTRLRIPDQSVAILQALLEDPGELVSREALRDRLWGPDTFVDFEAGLNAAVRRLREALNDSADTPRYVETLPRRGYRFIGPIDGATGTPTDSASAEATADKSSGAVAPVSLRSETVDARRVRVPRAVLAILALGIIGGALWFGLMRNTAAPVFSRPVPFTSFPGLELDPAISPTGTFVAFAWEGEGGDNFDIYVRSIDGTSQLQLTTNAAADHAPAWSPDGRRIAFVRVLDGKREIIVLPALGGSEQPLFEAGPELGGWFQVGASYGLSWTPDGKHLVFGDRTGSGPTSAIYSVLVRGWSETPAHTSAHESRGRSPGRFSQRPISRFPSPEPAGPRRERERLRAQARAVASGGEARPTDIRQRGRVRLDARQPQCRPRRGPRGARFVASRSGRRGGRACVTYQGGEALRGALRTRRHRLSECARRLEHLGTADAVLPESPALRRCDLSRDRVDVL